MSFIKDTKDTIEELHDYAKKQRDTEAPYTVDKMKFTYQTWFLGKLQNTLRVIEKVIGKKK